MTEPQKQGGPSIRFLLLAPSSRNRAVSWLMVAFCLLLLFAPPFFFPKDQYRLGLFAKYMALAILALSVDLAWGYTGLLSLGQGLFFGLGAYMVAYSLTLQKAAADMRVTVGLAPPQFMQYTGPAPNDPSYVVPPALAWIAPLGNIWVALTLAIVLPTIAAALFGWVTFRLRIRGVYFALVTQALLLAVFLLVRNQQRFTGGVVGIKDLADMKLFGHTFNLYKHIRDLNFLVAGALVASFLFCAWLVSTKFGKVLTAIRDNENRVLALGYNTALYKTLIFALAGSLAGLAGGLYVASNELCGPTYLSIPFSIEAVIWVAIGGRGTLLGPIVGTLLVGFTQSDFSSAFPNHWPIVQGLLFVLVVVALPNGIPTFSGRAALLCGLLGVIFSAFVDRVLGENFPETGRKLIRCGIMVGMVLVPLLLAWLSRLGLFWLTGAAFKPPPESNRQGEALSRSPRTKEPAATVPRTDVTVVNSRET